MLGGEEWSSAPAGSLGAPFRVAAAFMSLVLAFDDALRVRHEFPGGARGVTAVSMCVRDGVIKLPPPGRVPL